MAKEQRTLGVIEIFCLDWSGCHSCIHLLKFIKLYTLLFILLLFWLCWVFVVVHGLSSGMWDFSCPTRDQTHVLCTGSGFLTTGSPGKSLYTTPSTIIIIHVFTWSINSMSARGVSGIFPAPKAEPGIQ